MSATLTADIDQDLPAFDLGRIGLQVDADGRTLGLAGAVVEPAVMLGTLDKVVEHQTVCQMSLLMRAIPVSGEILVVRRAVDRESLTTVIEPHDVLFLDVADLASFDPVCHRRFLPCDLLYAAAAKPATDRC